MHAIPTTIAPSSAGTVVVAGDWHADAGWAREALSAVGDAGITTVLHVGDFGIFPDSHASFLEEVDQAAERAGVDRILVTPGNHEDWAYLTGLFSAHPGRAVRVTERIIVLPRGYRFMIGDRRFVSFGGAPSIDRAYRTRGVDWWPEETPTDSDVDRAISGGWADVMLLHDTITGNGVPAVEAILAAPTPLGVSRSTRHYLDAGRERVTRAWRAIGPALTFHGHYHVRGTGHLTRGRVVEALGMNGDREGNLVTLDTRSLSVAQMAVAPEGFIQTVR